MTNDLKIRDAREADRDTILAVTLTAYEQYAAAMGKMWEFYRANILSTLADVKPAEQIVAETQDGIVGTVLLFPADTKIYGPGGMSATFDLPEIRLLAVAPKARGQGIGAALTQECIRRARKAGVAAITLHTTDMMNVAMEMYERIGFVRTPETDFHPAENVTIKGYRLELAVQTKTSSIK